MARIEKTVFISYRREDEYAALAVYQDLTRRGYDVFLDYTNIHSGDFEEIIVSNIRARAHFVLILTPTALDNCSEPDDWLRREIETAIYEKRNIIPLFFDGFSFGSPSVAKKLTGKMAAIKRYNGIDIPSGFFNAAMERLSENFLNDPLDAVIHPVSNRVQRVVEEKQSAANKAVAGKKIDLNPEKEKKSMSRLYSISIALLSVTGLLVLGISSLLRNWSANEMPTATPANQVRATETVESVLLTPSLVVPTDTASPIPPTSPAATSFGDHILSPKDGMKLFYVPAGEFKMGSTGNEPDEDPVHSVYLDAYFIDETEVTNAMYLLCVSDGKCEPPRSNTSISQNASNGSSYYGNPAFANYPVIFVSSIDARAYCKWAGRRLPTEAEWEKAASWDDAKDMKRIYPWGNSVGCSYANFYGGDNSTLCIGDTTQVGDYPDGASFYGALDMAGNVWEWVADRYDPAYYEISDSANPTGPRSGDYIVIRGGSFLTGRSVGTRSSDRDKLPPDNTSHNVGFRCAVSQ